MIIYYDVMIRKTHKTYGNFQRNSVAWKNVFLNQQTRNLVVLESKKSDKFKFVGPQDIRF